MKQIHSRAFLVLLVAAVSIIVAACVGAPAPAAPTPAPTKPATSAPTAEPAKVPAAQPTAVPAKTATFPEQGKTLSLIVGFPPGGPNDLGARVIAPHLEREIGIPVQVVNKPGASQQVAMTELSLAKPDGYTIMYPADIPAITSYLDAERKAVYTRNSFQLLAQHVVDAVLLAVATESPYKTAKDVIEVAKAQPETVKAASTGILGVPHIGLLEVERLTGAKFATVHFEGAAPARTALLGDHVDLGLGYPSDYASLHRSGSVRILGTMGSKKSEFFPEVDTLEAQGYNIRIDFTRGFIMPAGAPQEVVDTLTNAIRKAMEAEEHKSRINEMFLTQSYAGPREWTAHWEDMEQKLKQVMAAAR